ncbi:DsbA family oxidoreductase [Halarchaeum sp. P4]|uniref:DsbA family oxidoreductase n=1 Tax=Halarchaeum sp. P4 TaxID=3421639 RepID=UPI003EBCD810
MTDQITVFSDYVCPFCYLGRQSLDEYQESREEELEIDWHPFDLRSNQRNEDDEIVRESGHDEEYYEQARKNVERLKAEHDADEMVVDRPKEIDSLDAQVASYYVKEHYDYETWLAFDESIFTAHWEEERDIGDVDVLADLAEEAGVDPEEVRDAVSDDTLREEVKAKFSEAHQKGVTGVPTFAYEGYAARGAVPPEQLRRLVEGQ